MDNNLQKHFNILETKIENGRPIQKIVNFDKMDLNQKSIVILCGNTTRTPVGASTYTKYIYDWLSNYPNRNQLNFYSIYYPNNQPLLTNFLPDSSFDYMELSNQIFSSLTTHNNKPLPADEICKNLDNIVFFGHSVGGMVMNNITNYLVTSLLLNKFSHEDIDKILSSIKFIAYSPFKTVDYHINNIYISPLYDSMGSTKKCLDALKQNNYSSTNHKISKIVKSKANYPYYADYFNHFSSVFYDTETNYVETNRTLLAIPNLLYFDGISEDHNLAGVIKYARPDPQKTKTGEATTEFMQLIFKYCLEHTRENFNTKELYNLAVDLQNHEEKSSENQK